MKKLPLLSVVVLTFNSHDTIKRCLESLNSQIEESFELIIVDDKSTDSTLDLIHSYKRNAKYPIRIFTNGQHNISRGRNIGIKYSKGIIVAFLDSDAYANPSWVKNIINAFSQDRLLVFIGGKEIPVFTNKFSKAISMNDDTIKKFTSSFWKIKGCNFAIRISKLPGVIFDESFIHDEETEYLTRIGKDNKWAYDDTICVEHESRTTPNKYLNQMYRYSKWRIKYSYIYKHFRAMDFVPTIIIIFSLTFSIISPYFLLLLPTFALMQTLVTLFYNIGNLEYILCIYWAWLIKNIGWGIGFLVGYFDILKKWGG